MEEIFPDLICQMIRDYWSLWKHQRLTQVLRCEIEGYFCRKTLPCEWCGTTLNPQGVTVDFHPMMDRHPVWHSWDSMDCTTCDRTIWLNSFIPEIHRGLWAGWYDGTVLKKNVRCEICGLGIYDTTSEES